MSCQTVVICFMGLKKFSLLYN
uniref:Uncharacterized protein n=1 Tax=Rhizophora mucronata TaxID=61149 RepID=A0A2P2N024_RHIMU